MSKKNYHSVRSTKKMLKYGSSKGMGPFRQRPQKKTLNAREFGKDAAPGAVNTEGGKAEPQNP